MTDLIEPKPGTQEQIMTRQQRMGAFAATMLLLLGSAGAALAVDLNLMNSVVGFHNPIGIDFQEQVSNHPKPLWLRATVVKLPRFRGHSNICVSGVHDAQDTAALPAGVPAENDRVGSIGTHAE